MLDNKLPSTLPTLLLRAGLLAGSTALTGCAYLTTYTRNIDLEGKNSIAMDVKQRVVFSQKLGLDTDKQLAPVVVCAEPSPDALTVLGISGGLDLSNGGKQQALGASAAFAESGAFIGLRTQSIQLLRDAMYRLCEGYAGQAVDGQDFIGMQRRYQSTMMGLIAIEQLTRPVVAGQVAIAAQAGASTGVSAGDAAVDKAETRFDEKAASLDKAKTEAKKQEDTLRDATVDLRQKELALQKAKDAEARTAAQEALITSREAKKEASRANEAAQRELVTAQRSYNDAEIQLLKARSGSSASASGSTTLEGNASGMAAMTRELVDGVEDIVEEINFSYAREACFSALDRESKLANKPVEEQTKSRSDANAQQVQSLWKSSADDKTMGGICGDLIKKYAQRYADKAATKKLKAEKELTKAQADKAKVDADVATAAAEKESADKAAQKKLSTKAPANVPPKTMMAPAKPASAAG
ncbi:hypothetical protein [Roseateles cavernae]|uniref:hypothetical protein n=1 Tax=Roseateles cavernae TaxID=3153578 RepID=UPI0032E4F210